MASAAPALAPMDAVSHVIFDMDGLLLALWKHDAEIMWVLMGAVVNTLLSSVINIRQNVTTTTLLQLAAILLSTALARPGGVVPAMAAAAAATTTTNENSLVRPAAGTTSNVGPDDVPYIFASPSNNPSFQCSNGPVNGFPSKQPCSPYHRPFPRCFHPPCH
ncbi:hypothetical protein GUJ93_ZPchr0011g27938 [Zizania palustris]|uniref:Uncharacterized protein n=1 Tax=Zizania palustris TaxID=103762 RepID=A0A8J5WJ63_ZIZPA|nr:hypothetical protein GUJ93_ZPchr0011g27938 [Zizania palustris]